MFSRKGHEKNGRKIFKPIGVALRVRTVRLFAVTAKRRGCRQVKEASIQEK